MPATLPATSEERSAPEREDEAVAGRGVTPAYRDNGDGTISDLNSGLMWEKKIKLDGIGDAANLHDADNCYPWAGTCAAGGAECRIDADCSASGPCAAASARSSASAMLWSPPIPSVITPASASGRSVAVIAA